MNMSDASVVCSDCGGPNEADSRFCIYCGAPITQGEPLEERVARLDRDVRELRQDVTVMRATLEREGLLRERRHEPAAAIPATHALTSPAAPARAASPAARGVPPTVDRTGRPPPVGPRLPSWLIDWERIIGGNWLAIVGAVAVAFGVGFFLKLAFDNEWIGEQGRVILGVAVGLGLLGAGEYTRGRYPAWSGAVTGGGIAVLYLAVYAAFSLYELLGTTPAFAFLILVTVTASALALRHESRGIAILGIAGGLLTPLMLRDRLPQEWALLSYILVLDLGVLGLASFRNWRPLTLLGLLGSLAVYGLWATEFDPYENLLFAQTALTLIFLIFVGATTLFHIIWRRAPETPDLALMALNAGAFFGISYGLLWEEFHPWMGGFTLALSAFYGLLGYLVIARSREHFQLSFMALGIALVFLTIAIPVQLGGPWISVAWAVEGAVLMWLSFKLRIANLRRVSVGVFILFAGALFLVDTPDAVEASLTPFLNTFTLAYLIGIGATLVAAYMVHRNREQIAEPETDALFNGFLVASNVLLTVLIPIQVSGAWIAFAWAVEALALVWLSFRLGIPALRMFGAGMFAVASIRVLGFDTWVELDGFRLIANQRMLAFASVIAGLYGGAYLARKYSRELLEGEQYAIGVLIVVANFLTLWVASAEIIAAVDSGIIDVEGSTTTYVKSLGLSLLWAVYGGALLVLGLRKGWKPVRLGGLALLIIPVLKLFLYDSFALEQGYRVAAFLTLGVILLIGGFLYQRHGETIKGFLFEQSKR